MSTPKKKTMRDYLNELIAGLFLLSLPLILVILPIVLIIRYSIGLWLGFLVKEKWFPQGKRLLFVYSNSPHWQNYIEENILPKIENQSIILNWSEKSSWNWKRKPLELRIFTHWTSVNVYSFKGRRKWFGDEYNPVAIIFIPWWKPKVIRFWKAFKDFKHGKEKNLRQLEEEFFKSIEIKRGL